MEDVVHPEQMPQGLAPPSSFRFSLAVLNDTKLATEGQIAQIEGRIDKITNGITVGDYPVIPSILQLTHDKDELITLAKALTRVADLVETLDELTTRKKVLDYAEKDPTWFAAAFADLKSEIDAAIPDDIDIRELLSEDN